MSIAIKPGRRGPEVSIVQHLLNARLNPDPPLNGKGEFGPRTKQLVIEFQRRYGLPETGEVNGAVLQVLGRQDADLGAMIGLPKDPAAPWMDIAAGELCQMEIEGSAAHNPRIVEYHACTQLAGGAGAALDETPWCSSFVCWVLEQAKIKHVRHALARKWLDWADGETLAAPRYGAVTVIKRTTFVPGTVDQNTGSSTGFHVGFFVDETDTHFRLLGGNQGGGTMVTVSSYRKFDWLSGLGGYEVRGHLWPRAPAPAPIA
jgi:uncharacterized protein (TIGR02594 family)